MSLTFRQKRPSVARGRKDALGEALSVDDTLREENEQKTSPDEFWKTARLLGSVMGSEWGLFVPGFTWIAISTTATIAEPWALGRLIDQGILQKNRELFSQWVLFFAILQVVRVISASKQAYTFEKLGQRVMQKLRVGLYTHLQQVPVEVFDRTPVGRIITRLTNDISSLAELCSAGFVTVGGNFVTVIGILISLLFLDFQLGLVTAAIFPFLAGPSIYFSSLLRETYRITRLRLSSLNAFLAENILGMKVVQLFNREPLHQEKFEKLNSAYAEAQTGSVKVFALFQPSITLAAGFSTALVMVVGGWRSLEGTLPIGVLVAYFAYVQALYQPLREMAEKWNLFLSGMTSAERIFALTVWPQEEGTAPDHLHSRPVPQAPQRYSKKVVGEIRFENVWFAYSGENWVLRDFSWTLQAGKTVGIVGHTGAGKSTLTSLLLRFYDIQRGRITIDGVDIREIPRRTLRQIFGVVQQEAFLFSGSVKENLTLWRDLTPETENEVRSTLRLLGREHWWQTHQGAAIELDERGGNISAGERQILSFVRALAQEPSIWILDEATAHIDSGTEAQMSSWVKTAFANRTALIVAHRLATIRDADEIIVLNRGELVESGRHESLMKLNGLYARLYRYQSAVDATETQPSAPTMT